MIEHIGWLKSFGGLLKAIVDRLANWVMRRKPKVYVRFEPNVSVWCIATSGNIEYMQISCNINITHDDEKKALIITDAYPVGTRTEVRAMTEFKVPSHTMTKERIVSIAGPLVAEKGKDWTGKLILVDQFIRKYKTPKATFKWVGPK